MYAQADDNHNIIFAETAVLASFPDGMTVQEGTHILNARNTSDEQFAQSLPIVETISANKMQTFRDSGFGKILNKHMKSLLSNAERVGIIIDDTDRSLGHNAVMALLNVAPDIGINMVVSIIGKAHVCQPDYDNPVSTSLSTNEAGMAQVRELLDAGATLIADDWMVMQKHAALATCESFRSRKTYGYLRMKAWNSIFEEMKDFSRCLFGYIPNKPPGTEAVIRRLYNTTGAKALPLLELPDNMKAPIKIALQGEVDERLHRILRPDTNSMARSSYWYEDDDRLPSQRKICALFPDIIEFASRLDDCDTALFKMANSHKNEDLVAFIHLNDFDTFEKITYGNGTEQIARSLCATIERDENEEVKARVQEIKELGIDLIFNSVFQGVPIADICA